MSPLLNQFSETLFINQPSSLYLLHSRAGTLTWAAASRLVGEVLRRDPSEWQHE